MSGNKMSGRVAVAGAGFSGAVIANSLANAGYSIDVFEERSHIGGNCFTYRDSETDVLVHKYGPHIFHTDREDIWKYINGFSRFRPYINRVKAVSRNRVYSLCRRQAEGRGYKFRRLSADFVFETSVK